MTIKRIGNNIYQTINKIEAYIQKSSEISYTERPYDYNSNTLYGYIDLFRYRISSKYIKNTGILLDIGTGRGYGINYLHEMTVSNPLIGVDVSKNALKMAFNKNRDYKINYIMCDASYLPFKDNRFTYITCIELIEHIDSPFLLLKEMYRIINKEGKMVISTPNNLIIKILTGKSQPLNPYHRVEFTLNELKNTLKKYNFKISRTIGFYVPLPIVRKIRHIIYNKFYIILSCHALSFFPQICLYQLHLCTKNPSRA